MTGITKQEASILWGNGFKLKDKEGNEWRILSVNPYEMEISSMRTRDEGDTTYQFKTKTNISEIGKDYFIICHSLDKLTQPIMHEGKECVAIVELAKIDGIYTDDVPYEVRVTGKGLYCFHQELCRFMFKEGSFNCWLGSTPTITENQPALFAYMDSRHFDRFGWQERGLTTPK